MAARPGAGPGNPPARRGVKAPPPEQALFMKRTDILFRQDRIVYILLVVTAAVGLAWVIWRHQLLAARAAGPAPAAAPAR